MQINWKRTKTQFFRILKKFMVELCWSNYVKNIFLAGFGNPLLDIIVAEEFSQTLVKKYDLYPNIAQVKCFLCPFYKMFLYKLHKNA